MALKFNSRINLEITEKVAEFYERFPYPFYPLLARPYYPDAYWSSSQVLGILASDLMGTPCGVLSQLPSSHHQNILVLGCGDTQPYLFKKWEPLSHKMIFVDLSQKSIKRARLRFGMHRRNVDWIHADLCAYLSEAANHGVQFSHIDAYGVLHHLAEPSLALALIAKTLTPNGTLRLMVYNQKARDWIREIQKVFKLCKLSSKKKEDRLLAKNLLVELRKLPSIAPFFQGLGDGIFSNESRLCDTFFNEREVSWLPDRWIQALKKYNLKPLSLLDRYGELDDLENPLWNFPSEAQLQVRYLDKRFENNLEILAINQELTCNHNSLQAAPFNQLRRSGIPEKWFDYLETNNNSRRTRKLIWDNFKKRLMMPDKPLPLHLNTKKQASLKRLARLGAIFPANAKESGLFELMTSPLCETMEAPTRPLAKELTPNLHMQIKNILKIKNLDDSKFLPLITHRVLRINQ